MFPHRILSLFSSLPLSKARVWVCVCVSAYACVRAYVCVCAPIPHNWSWYQSLISPEGLTRLLRQPREDLISLHFPDYLPIGIHWVERETKTMAIKVTLNLFYLYIGLSSMTQSVLSVLNWNASISKWLLGTLCLKFCCSLSRFLFRFYRYYLLGLSHWHKPFPLQSLFVFLEISRGVKSTRSKVVKVLLIVTHILRKYK